MGPALTPRFLQPDGDHIGDAIDGANRRLGVGRHGGIDVEDHQRRATLAGGFREGADIHMVDVDAGVAEHRADAADHAGAVDILAEQDVTMRGKVGAIAVDAHDAFFAPGDGARQGMRLAVTRGLQRDEIGILLGAARLMLHDLQSPLARQQRRIHQIHPRL